MRFFHASKDPHISETVIYPRVPNFRMVSEEFNTARVCTSMSIIGCLCAMQKLEVGEIIYMYSCEAEYYIQPTEEQVADVAYTGEVWLIEATKIEYYAELVIESVQMMIVDNFEVPIYQFRIVDK